MNAVKAIKTTEEERFFVPRIVSTTPKPVTKEIDLTFVQFAQRKRAATTYIESVARRKEKVNHKNKIVNVIAGLLFTVAFSLCFFGIALLGIMM